MNYSETKRISQFLTIAIVLIIGIGFIAGIAYGVSFRAPTEEAVEAIDRLARHYDYEDSKIAEEKEWTFASTVAMLGTWFASAIASLLLYIKKYQVEMTDATVGFLIQIQQQIKALEKQNV